MPRNLPFPNATFVLEVFLPLATEKGRWAAEVIKEALAGTLVVEEVKHHPALEVMWDDKLRPLEHIGMSAFFDNRVRGASGEVTHPLGSDEVMEVVRKALDVVASDAGVGGFVLAQVRNKYTNINGDARLYDLHLEVRLPECFSDQCEKKMKVSRPFMLSGQHALQWGEISTPEQNQRLNKEFANLQSMQNKNGVLRRAVDWLASRHLEQTLPSAPQRAPGVRF